MQIPCEYNYIKDSVPQQANSLSAAFRERNLRSVSKEFLRDIQKSKIIFADYKYLHSSHPSFTSSFLPIAPQRITNK